MKPFVLFLVTYFCVSGLPLTRRVPCSVGLLFLSTVNHMSVCVLQVTEQHPTSGLWKGFRCTTSGLMTRPGYFPATSVVLIDPHSQLPQRLLCYVWLIGTE